MPTEWWPARLLDGQRPQSRYGLIILNQAVNKNALSRVIEHASAMVCADGGANRLHDYDLDSMNGLQHRLPEAIIGDLDSLRPDVESVYQAKGVAIVADQDQYSTDFTKCLKWLRHYALSHPDGDGEASEALDVIALGGLGGRVDQGFSQIHHLYMADEDKELLNGRLYLLSEQSLSFILGIGQHVIHVEPGPFAENIGIIPAQGPATIATKGLEWDVSEWKTEIGGQVSTSNHIRSDTLEINVSGRRVLFTVELNHKLTTAAE